MLVYHVEYHSFSGGAPSSETSRHNTHKRHAEDRGRVVGLVCDFDVGVSRRILFHSRGRRRTEGGGKRTIPTYLPM